MSTFQYEEVPAGHVPVETQKAAWRMKEFVEADLGLQQVPIRWFREYDHYSNLRRYWGHTFEGDRAYRGCAMKSEGCIWIRADLEPEQAKEAVAHELRHVHQYQTGFAGDTEGDAKLYGQLAVEALRHWPGNVSEARKITARVSGLLEVRFPKRLQLEYRSLALRGAGGETISGYAAVFNQLSLNLGGFREVIRPGAFKGTLERGADVRALFNHDPSKILGRTKAGTLKLKEDRHGLWFELQPAVTPTTKEVVANLRAGNLDGCSFAFRALKDHWRAQGGENVRELVEVDLQDISIVTFPAYPATSVQVL